MKTVEEESSTSEGIYFATLFFHYIIPIFSIFIAFLIFFFLALRSNRLGSGCHLS